MSHPITRSLRFFEGWRWRGLGDTIGLGLDLGGGI